MPDDETLNKTGLRSFDRQKYKERISDHEPTFLNEGDDPKEAARKILGWGINYRWKHQNGGYQWRTGTVLAISGRPDKNVVVQFEQAPCDLAPLDHNHLFLDVRSFGDGSDHDDECWFRLELLASANRDMIREATEAREAFGRRTHRHSVNEIGDGRWQPGHQPATSCQSKSPRPKPIKRSDAGTRKRAVAPPDIRPLAVYLPSFFLLFFSNIFF